MLAVPLVSPFYLLTIRREGVPPVSSRAEIRKAVVRYGLYVNSRKWIDGIFNELDKDGSAARSEHRLGSDELGSCALRLRAARDTQAGLLFGAHALTLGA